MNFVIDLRNVSCRYSKLSQLEGKGLYTTKIKKCGLIPSETFFHLRPNVADLNN